MIICKDQVTERGGTAHVSSRYVHASSVGVGLPACLWGSLSIHCRDSYGIVPLNLVSLLHGACSFWN